MKEVRGVGLLVGIELDMMAGPVVEVARDMGVLAITAGKVRTCLGWQWGGEQYVWEYVREGPGIKMASRGGERHNWKAITAGSIWTRIMPCPAGGHGCGHAGGWRGEA